MARSCGPFSGHVWHYPDAGLVAAPPAAISVGTVAIEVTTVPEPRMSPEHANLGSRSAPPTRVSVRPGPISVVDADHNALRVGRRRDAEHHTRDQSDCKLVH